MSSPPTRPLVRCRRPGAALTFRLQCAFQAATKRVFIHASEMDSRGEPVKDNIQIMGLQLPNYVPAGDQCTNSSAWEGGRGPGSCGRLRGLTVEGWLQVGACPAMRCRHAGCPNRKLRHSAARCLSCPQA